jgi:hypothetical protein
MARISINLDSLKPKREWKRHKIQDGDNIYRILPPFGKPEVHNGYAYNRWSVIWGLTDPSTGKNTPVASPSMTEKRCPVYEYVDLLSEKVEQMKSELQAKGVDAVSIKEQLKVANEVIKDLRPKTVFAYNACSKSGEIGILELKTTAHKGIQKEMYEYIRDYNQDPTSLNSDEEDSGVWFKITRSGQNFQTEYAVTKNQSLVKMGAGKAYVDDRTALPDSVVSSFHDSGYDLSTLYRKKSYDEVKALLMFNLGRLTENGRINTELLVEGFGKFGPVSVTPETATYEVTTTGKTTAVKPKVALKIDESFNDAPFTSADDDMFKMADDILNGE